MGRTNLLRKMAGNPNLIPGIYNYCDGWCDRCGFTARCLNFSYSERHFSRPEERDINNRAFWDRLAETFQITLEMVREHAEREGIDLNSADMDEIRQREEDIMEAAENHECSLAGQAYCQMVDRFLDNPEGPLKEKQEELNHKHRLEIPGLDAKGETADISECLEIIRWYEHQIYVKLVRALSGVRDDEDEDYPRDSDGSAKVALLGLDRSITAWGQMYNHFPEYQNDILDILVHLERLRRKTESEFPHARSFVRPGFDAK